MSPISLNSSRGAALLIGAALAACSAGDSITEDDMTDRYLGDVFTERSRIIAQVYTPNTCLAPWTPLVGCRDYSDESSVTCMERAARDGLSTDNGVDSVSFRAADAELRTVVPGASGFVAFDLGGTEVPNRLRVLGTAGEFLADLVPADRPVADASGDYSAVFDPTDTSTTLQATWQASSTADVACVSTFATDGGLSRRCCGKDMGQLDIWTDGAVDRVWLERFNFLGQTQDERNELSQWQSHSTQLVAVGLDPFPET